MGLTPRSLHRRVAHTQRNANTGPDKVTEAGICDRSGGTNLVPIMAAWWCRYASRWSYQWRHLGKERPGDQTGAAGSHL